MMAKVPIEISEHLAAAVAEVAAITDDDPDEVVERVLLRHVREVRDRWDRSCRLVDAELANLGAERIVRAVRDQADADDQLHSGVHGLAP